jgi:hypothetical protein
VQPVLDEEVYRLSYVSWSAHSEWFGFGSDAKSVSIWNVRKEEFLRRQQQTEDQSDNLPGRLLKILWDIALKIILFGSGVFLLETTGKIFQGYNGRIHALAIRRLIYPIRILEPEQACKWQRRRSVTWNIVMSCQ